MGVEGSETLGMTCAGGARGGSCRGSPAQLQTKASEQMPAVTALVSSARRTATDLFN
jgi:hypothetical protein